LSASENLSDLRRCQAKGELAAGLDPGLFQLARMGAFLAPTVLPQIVRRIAGLDPQSPEFERRYSEQLRRIIRRLAAQTQRR
jgi:TetR/AcrR family transcriptional regulator